MFYLSVESCCYFAGWASSSLCVCGYGGACGEHQRPEVLILSSLGRDATAPSITGQKQKLRIATSTGDRQDDRRFRTPGN